MSPRISRQQIVLGILTAANGGWVDGPELCQANTGGTEGLKRLRELRAAGHPIEKRHHPSRTRPGTWQYRLPRAGQEELW